jgi:hypothetical protein
MNVIYDAPVSVIVVLMLLLSIAATEVGFRYGKRRMAQRSDREFTMTTGIKASIIGLVALLLGFSFSITSSRFAQRARMMVDEANALATCYDRAGLLRDPARTRIRAALRRYLGFRFEYFRSDPGDEVFKRATLGMNAELRELWAGVTEAVQADQMLVLTSQIVPAASQVSDEAMTRQWATIIRLPSSVVVLLGMCIVISGALVGHSSAEAGARHPGLWVSLNVLIILVVFVILDFDRPRRGFIQVDRGPLIEVRDAMRR